MSNPDRAVVVHLVRLIQDNPDVRYYVGGSHTQMRQLLVAAIKAAGFDGDPLDALKPAPHRANEEPRIKRFERDVERLENGIEAIREALLRGDERRAMRMVELLQAGEAVTNA